MLGTSFYQEDKSSLLKTSQYQSRVEFLREFVGNSAELLDRFQDFFVVCSLLYVAIARL